MFLRRWVTFAEDSHGIMERGQAVLSPVLPSPARSREPSCPTSPRVRWLLRLSRELGDEGGADAASEPGENEAAKKGVII